MMLTIAGLQSLGQLHAEYPSLTRNATFEAALLPEAAAWREDVRFAARPAREAYARVPVCAARALTAAGSE